MKKNIKNTAINSGFKVPENYFNDFENSLLTELSLKESVSNSGFKVPDSYFENFKVNTSTTEKSKVIPLFNKKTWIYISGIAAAVLIFINISIIDKSTDFATLDNNSIEEYLLTNDTELLDINTLVIDANAFESAILKESVSDASLEDYLYNNAELEDLN